MKRLLLATSVVAAALLLFATWVAIACTSALHAEEKLERGQDRIDTPAIGSGLCVHNLFQSNMVVQRDKPMPIWGWAAPGESITVSFGRNTKSVTAAADRSWKVELPAIPASAEPRTITVQGKDGKIELTNILVGDVWLLGGQSNMEFEIAKLEEGPLEILSANFDQIRLFTVPQQNGPETKIQETALKKRDDKVISALLGSRSLPPYTQPYRETRVTWKWKTKIQQFPREPGTGTWNRPVHMVAGMRMK